LPFTKRMDLFDELIPPLIGDDPVKADLPEFSRKARALQSRRDLIVHGAVSNSEQIKDAVRYYWFRRIRWDNPVKVKERRRYSVDQIDRVAMDISNLIAESLVFELIVLHAP